MDERGVQRSLADWLNRRANAKVYWAENPPEEYERFSFENADHRPDLLAISDLTVVAELKDGDDSKGVYEAMSQLHDYWVQYEYGDSHVRVANETIDVDAFVIATQYSPDGHLFKRDPQNEGIRGEDREKGFRQTYGDDEFWNHGNRPQYEYTRTEAIPRIQWRYAWYEAERQNETKSDIDTGLGILLSDLIDDRPEQSVNTTNLGYRISVLESPTRKLFHQITQKY